MQISPISPALPTGFKDLSKKGEKVVDSTPPPQVSNWEDRPFADSKDGRQQGDTMDEKDREPESLCNLSRDC